MPTHEPRDAPLLIDIRTASTRSGLPPGTLYDLIAQGVVPPTVVLKLGRRLWLRRSEFETWLLGGGLVANGERPREVE